MGVIDPKLLQNVVYTNSDHLLIDMLLHTDVCSLGLIYARAYEQYAIKPLAIENCEPFLQLGYVQDPERPLSPQAQWLIQELAKIL